ncbi:MAG: HepT-like ribonuclease domain-containing protein [Pseudomonadota bacterium]|nr:HepT-like ribonuclease domain-containing protein [Pseudomonadota bacterium]
MFEYLALTATAVQRELDRAGLLSGSADFAHDERVQDAALLGLIRAMRGVTDLAARLLEDRGRTLPRHCPALFGLLADEALIESEAAQSLSLLAQFCDDAIARGDEFDPRRLAWLIDTRSEQLIALTDTLCLALR